MLVAIAEVLMAFIRQWNEAARWDSEGLMLLLPDTDIKEASILVEKSRRAMAGIHLRYTHNESVITAIRGVAQRETLITTETSSSPP